MSRNGHLVEGIQQEMSSYRSSCIVHVRREANSAAHTLIREATNHVINSVWFEDIPNSIFGIVNRERIYP